MKSMLATAFGTAMVGLAIAAPSAQAGTEIHTNTLKNGPCHVGQTYEIGLSHILPGRGELTFTDNGVAIPINWLDHNMSYVEWTPTTTGKHTLKLSGDITESGEALIELGSSQLAGLGSGSGLFRAPSATVQTMVVNASDTTTPCLQ